MLILYQRLIVKIYKCLRLEYRETDFLSMYELLPVT